MSSHIHPDSSPVRQPPRPPKGRLLLALIGGGIGMLLLGALLGPSLQSAWQRLLPAGGSSSSSSSTAAEEGAETVWYQSQMHPWIIQPYPGQCPVCGMDLTPVDPQRFGAEVTVSPMTVQNIGVSAQPAQLAVLQREVRSVGIFDYDPGRSVDISVRSPAWIENLQVQAVGDRVQAGQHLFDLVSQELYSAQVEYLQVRSDERLRHSAQRRLAYLGMTDLSALEESSEALHAVPVYAPSDGVVIERNAVEGMRMPSGATALRIAGDDQLWLRVTLFEQQLTELQAGMAAQVRLRDGRQLRGELAYIEPALDPQTRSLAARIVVPNPDGALRPGTFAEVRIPLPAAEPQVLIPRSAVVSSGERNLVFISLGRGRFAPREVGLGAVDDQGQVAITSGLNEGEQVVVSGQFLIDAESRMVEAIARMIFPDRVNSSPSTPSTPDVPRTPVAQSQRFTPLLESYADVAMALYGEDTEHIGHQLMALREALTAGDMPTSLIDHVDAMAAAGADLGPLRSAFGALGVGLRDYLEAQPDPPQWTVFYCGMADAPEDGVWLQASDGEARNPFFGARHGMRACHIDALVLSAPTDQEEAP